MNIPENYPGFFSFGRVSKAGVPREKAENTNFVMTVVGEGWAAPGQQDTQPQPGRRVVTTVSGSNIGYVVLCSARSVPQPVVQSRRRPLLGPSPV